MFNYAIDLSADDNGTFLVTCPDFPEVATFGEDKEDAVLRALDAIEEAIAARIAHREEVPAASSSDGRPTVELPLQTMFKVMLYQAMALEGIRKAELARRLDVHAPQVDRLLDLHHSSRVEQLEKAIKATGHKFAVCLA